MPDPAPGFSSGVVTRICRISRHTGCGTRHGGVAAGRPRLGDLLLAGPVVAALAAGKPTRICHHSCCNFLVMSRSSNQKIARGEARRKHNPGTLA